MHQCLRGNIFIQNQETNFYGIILENWIKMKPSAVCFGARDDTYGLFKIPVAGSIITFKLIYLNSSVSCAPDFNSNWGCYHSAVSNHPMGIHTDSKKTRLLSKNKYLKGGLGCLSLYYSLPWATPDSLELLFDNFSVPLAVTANQEFLVWFTEGLNNCGVSDNGPEKTCAEVHGLYA